MRPYRGAVGACALVLLAVGSSPLHAAWNNVFQVCCHTASPPAVSYAAPDPCCTPCPQTVCSTSYVVRSYYQPVTSYQTRSYYEPVTTYRTSYYYEPVTSYRYSMYFDPCTCSYQQVACPTVSYRLRAQSCPVQTWVQRCCTVPVTTYQQAFYYEPVTTCCSVTPACPPPCPPAAAVPGAPSPGVAEQRSLPPVPGVQENGGGAQQQYYPPQNTMPRLEGSSSRQVPLRAPAAPMPPPPVVKLDRIVSAPSPGIEGQVVRADRSPQPGARLLFVSSDRQGVRESVTADAAGRFQAALASGGWLVYVYSPEGRPVFHRRIEVRDRQTDAVLLVSREH